MRSISDAAKDLQVSRTKIYTLIKNCNFETKDTLNKKYIKDEDFEKMKEIISYENSDNQFNKDNLINEIKSSKTVKLNSSNETVSPDNTHNTHKTAKKETDTPETSNPEIRLNNILNRDRYIINSNISDREYVDLKERIDFLESQLHVKDHQLKEKDNQLSEALKSNNNLIDTNKTLLQFNALKTAKFLNTEDVETKDVEFSPNKDEKFSKKRFSFFRNITNIFKKNNV